MVENRHDPTLVYGNLLESRLRHVEVLQGRVAPPAVVVRKIVVRRAEVGDRDGHRRPLEAPLGLVVNVTDELEALSAGYPVVEQRGAQCCRVSPVALGIQVAISTSTPYLYMTETYYILHF